MRSWGRIIRREKEDSAMFYVVVEITKGGEAEFSVGGVGEGEKRSGVS